MNRRGCLALIATGIVFPTLSGCKTNESTLRFRLTVEVDTPDGMKSGFSVMEVSAWGYSAAMNGQSRGMAWRGEAVAVDLPGGHTLFALLRAKDTSPHIDLAETAMAALDPAYRNDWVESAARIASGTRIRSFADLRPESYPMLVTFGDIADSTSVEEVEPDALEDVFGPGVRLRRITVQLTDDNVTSGIRDRLGWLSAYPEPSLNPDHGLRDFSLPAKLHHGDFNMSAAR